MAKFEYDIDYRKEYPGVDISEEVIAFLKENDLKRKYFEYELKTEKQIRRKVGASEDDTPIVRPSREDSLNRLTDLAMQFASSEDVETSVIKKLMIEKLMDCVSQLSKDEQELITELFFNGKSEREWSEEIGIHFMTIHNRKVKIIKKLKKLMNF
ncbi:sigma-70 family RNA polymerase sigma factor [Pygmaiobacter massiliensis]|uniref:sigma-70 family RNA polymerase sigma factor n=1 Tax=Pygmaiobacter massiliensis TaxID=1917873 RepID=UPI00289D9932|nr:sigma-70 family RNA polymerase sigma factor [Pygmaiobacter massiliensis]